MRTAPRRLDAGARRRRDWLPTGGLVAVLVVTYYAVPMDGRWWPVGAVAGPIAVVALVPVSLRHTRRILASDRPLATAARAIMVMLPLLVLGFATTYYALESHSPGQMVGLATKTDAVYFTVTVLATVGFGDIHPVGQIARAVATFHMLADLVVVTVAVRLVIRAGRQRLAGDDLRPRLSPDDTL